MRRFGIELRTAQEQIQHDRPVGVTEAFQPLPTPTGTAPYRLPLSNVLGSEPTSLSLFVLGDHGGVEDPNPQKAVAAALVAAQQTNPASAIYSVGDVVYFNGAKSEYPPQFQGPYADLLLPFFAIPGNHDGDPEEDGEPSLAAFMRYFCAAKPELLPEVAEYNRDTMDQPNCYWTLTSAHATIIGLYSNVPSGGVIEPDQAAWLVEELKAAPTGVPLVVSLHHPPYSIDAHHGGSAKMGELLDKAFTEADRCPDLVLSGHVHDYQRFSRSYWGRTLTYVVIGDSGYHNLHAFASGTSPGFKVTEDVTFEAGDDKRYGFLRLNFTPTAILGTYTSVTKEGVVEVADTFTVPVGTS